MWCPKCAYPHTKVYGTQKGLNNYRYRSCPQCGYKFITEESVLPDDHSSEYAKYLEEIGETKISRYTPSLFDEQ